MKDLSKLIYLLSQFIAVMRTIDIHYIHTVEQEITVLEKIRKTRKIKTILQAL